MAGISLNMADAVILAIVIATVALIIRGMVQGRIKTCDCSSCAGNCGSCGQACGSPRIKLSDQQRAQLCEIDRRAQKV